MPWMRAEKYKQRCGLEHFEFIEGDGNAHEREREREREKERERDIYSSIVVKAIVDARAHK